jgi:hypothetical protein
MIRLPLASLLAAALLLAAVPTAAQEPDIDDLFRWMTGSFSSAAQAEDDSNFHHITLEMTPIWTERAGEHWFYVEQAVAGMQDKPYRQRVYQVRRGADGIIESAVYLLPDPGKHVGAWQAESPLAGLKPEDLEPRSGCTVYLEYDRERDRFVGGTRGTGCASSLRGAAYATSEVVILPGRIESWDRGFDADGRQVWGSEAGPYVFIWDEGPFESPGGR